jgi:squalene cyclase
LPELSDQDAVNWLIGEWGKDIRCDTRLTYKGAFFLMGLSASGVLNNNCPLIEETYSFLAQEQNDDGGFGPWKDHPIGSDPWSTGIVLLGLLSYPDLAERKVIESAVNWLAENQLPNGLWSYKRKLCLKG